MTVLAASVAAHAPASSQVVPGVLGFLVVAGMGLALFFLLRSMNKHLRKVTPQQPAKTGAAKAGQARGDGADSPGD